MDARRAEVIDTPEYSETNDLIFAAMVESRRLGADPHAAVWGKLSEAVRSEPDPQRASRLMEAAHYNFVTDLRPTAPEPKEAA